MLVLVAIRKSEREKRLNIDTAITTLLELVIEQVRNTHRHLYLKPQCGAEPVTSTDNLLRVEREPPVSAINDQVLDVK